MEAMHVFVHGIAIDYFGLDFLVNAFGAMSSDLLKAG